MRVLCISDPHQTTVGLDYVEEHMNEADKVVVLGDFMDNFSAREWWGTETHNPIIVFNKWANLCRRFPDKFLLCVGNHDLAYLDDDRNVSGHQDLHHYEIKAVLMSNLDLLNVAYEINGWVFSHAGITKTWAKKFEKKYELEATIENINSVFHSNNFSIFGFQYDCYDPYGYNVGQSPLWVRPSSLAEDAAFPKQIVGHTEEPTIIDGKDDVRIIICENKEHNNFQFWDI